MKPNSINNNSINQGEKIPHLLNPRMENEGNMKCVGTTVSVSKMQVAIGDSTSGDMADKGDDDDCGWWWR